MSLLFCVQDHKNCGEMTEIEAKVKYVKLARSLQTYGVSFFLVKVRAKAMIIYTHIKGKLVKKKKNITSLLQ